MMQKTRTTMATVMRNAILMLNIYDDDADADEDADADDR